VTLIPWAQGQCLIWNVTIPDTVAASHLIGLSLLLEQQPNTQPLRKSSNMPTIMHSYDFVPIAVEKLGLWSSDALTFI